jgi:hypothetical protein
MRGSSTSLALPKCDSANAPAFAGSSGPTETRCGLDYARSPDRHEYRTFIERPENPVSLEWGFAEPANMWADFAAAIALWKFSGRLVDIGAPLDLTHGVR